MGENTIENTRHSISMASIDRTHEDITFVSQRYAMHPGLICPVDGDMLLMLEFSLGQVNLRRRYLEDAQIA